MAVISEEIKNWEDRVYFGDLKFKEENSNPSSVFYKTIKKLSDDILLSKFRVVACEYEAQTYKIPRLMIEKFNFVNEDFTFDNGVNLQAYIGNPSDSVWSLQDRAKEYVQKNKRSFKNKVVIIPLIDFKVDGILAIYFVDQLEIAGAKGLIFSYEGNNQNSMMHNLAFNSYNKLLQFPKPLIGTVGHKLKDDGL